MVVFMSASAEAKRPNDRVDQTTEKCQLKNANHDVGGSDPTTA
jgi:hypothetical protein